jgi:hypothetical protein
MSELVRYDAMIHAISECHLVDEVKELRDKARALELYAQQARNLDAERKAAEVRLRAERRAGEMLKEQAANGQRARGGGDVRNKESQPAILSDLKITPTQSSRWQALAQVPKAEFEAALQDPVKKPTTTGIINRASTTPTIDPEALWFWGRLREFEQRGFCDADPKVILDEMTDAMRADCARLIPLVSDFLQRCREVL